jgi:hypothetical protein
MYQAQIFVAKRVPSETELHCLVAHLTNKQPVPVKIVRNGRVISVIGAIGAITPKTVVLEHNAFEFKRTEGVQPYAAQAGDIATVSTQLCYTINKTPKAGSKGGTVSPIDAYGRIKPECRTHFLTYLEKQTGLTGLLAGVAEIGITPLAMPSIDERRHKVWFVGAMQLTLRAHVGDSAVFNALAGVAIGNRRNYGFGAVACDMVEKAVALEVETT